MDLLCEPEDLLLGLPQPRSLRRLFKHQEPRRSLPIATLPMPGDSAEKFSPPSPATDGKAYATIS